MCQLLIETKKNNFSFGLKTNYFLFHCLKSLTIFVVTLSIREIVCPIALYMNVYLSTEKVICKYVRLFINYRYYIPKYPFIFL